LIQNDFTAAKIVQQVERLLPDGAARESMMKELKAVGASLRSGLVGSGQTDRVNESAGAIERVAAVTLEMLGVGSPALDPSVVQS
jgi:lipid A disaccharide synthetase